MLACASRPAWPHARVQVYLVSRHGTWLLTRVAPTGMPVDYTYTTRSVWP